MQRLFITTVLLLFVAQICKGQHTDSLYKLLSRTQSDSAKARILGDLAYLISSNNPDSALKLGWQGMALAKKARSKPAEANCLQSIGWTYFRSGKNDSAILFLTEATGIFHGLKRAWDEGRCLKNMGSVYSSTRDYTKAFACLIPAKKLFEDLHDERYAAYIDKEIGGIYRQKGMLNLARQYLSAAIETFESLHDNAYLADAFSAYGSVFWAMKEYDSALLYYRKEYKLCLTTGATANEAYAAENMANAFEAKCGEKNISPWADSALFYITN